MNFDWDAPLPSLSEQVASRFVPEGTGVDGGDEDDLLEIGVKPSSRGRRGTNVKVSDTFAPSGKLLLSADVPMSGKVKGAKKTSRTEWFQGDEDGDEDEDGDDEDEDDEREDDEDNHRHKVKGGRKMFKMDDDEDVDDVDDVDEDDDEDDDEDGDNLRVIDQDNDQDNDHDDDDDDEVMDTSGIMAAMQAARKAEMEKAKVVEKQVWCFQRALALRIKLQSVLALANKCPLPDSDVVSSESAASCKDSICECLRQMGKLLSVVPESPPNSGSADSWWHWLNKNVNLARVAHDETIVEEWNRRTDASLGGAGSGRTFKALGRPVMEQIRFALRNDMPRLVRRSQMNRAQAIPLGGSEEAPERMEEIYDDGDFYGQLLKSFIEASSAAAAASGPRVMRLQKGKKMTREEKKRRKLEQETVVRQELLNFMAPLASTQLPPMADPLFGSLFR